MMRREGMAGVLDLGLDEATALSLDVAPAPERASLRTLGRPAFLMSLPLFLSTEEPNNVLMEAMSERERRIDRRNASLAVRAVAHAAGLPDPHQETDTRCQNG